MSATFAVDAQGNKYEVRYLYDEEFEKNCITEVKIYASNAVEIEQQGAKWIDALKVVPIDSGNIVITLIGTQKHDALFNALKLIEGFATPEDSNNWPKDSDGKLLVTWK